MANNISFPGYYESEIIENGCFPMIKNAYNKNIKIINNLDYGIYIHSIFPVVKIDPNSRNEMGFTKKEVLIFCESITSSGKQTMLKISIPQEELDQRMVFIKELNILICTMDDYISNNNDRDNGFLTREINNIDKYIGKALENRIDNSGEIPIFFNFNDPSRVYNKIFLYIFGAICEINIDNNALEKPIAQIVIKGIDNKQTKYIHLDPKKVFEERKAFHETVGDIDVLCCVDYETLKRAIITYKTSENKMVSYEFLVEKEKELKSKLQIEIDIKDNKIKELESLAKINKTKSATEINILNNKIIQLKEELNRSYQLLQAELNVSSHTDKFRELKHKEDMRKMAMISIENKHNHEIKMNRLTTENMMVKNDLENEKFAKEIELLEAKKNAEKEIARSKVTKEKISLFGNILKVIPTFK